MNKFKQDTRKNYWIVVVILTVASLIVGRLQLNSSRQYVSTHLSSFPQVLGEWEGEDIDVGKHVTDILGTNDVLLRRYRDKEGDSLILTIVYSKSRRDSFHPPEYCYIGGGAQLADRLKEKIYIKDGGSLTTNKLILKHPHGTIKAWYWYAVGDNFTDSYYLQQVYFALSSLKGIKKGGALIRVSTENPDGSSDKRVKEFIKLALPFLRQVL